jgi:transposase InsO family protein
MRGSLCDLVVRAGLAARRHRPRRGTPVVLTHMGKMARRIAGAHDIYELTQEMSPRDVAELKRLLGLVIRARQRYRKPTQ